MNWVDYIALAILILFAVDGARKGLVRSLIPIIAFTLCSIIAVFSFDVSQNIIKASLIVTAGSIVLTALATVVLIIARWKLNAEDKNYIFWGSRLAGGLLSLLWKGSWLGMGLVLTTVLPSTLFGEDLKKNIRSSQSYFYAEALLVTPTPILAQAKESLNALSHPGWFEPIRASAEYQEFIKHPKVETILSDQAAIDQIHRKDVLGLLANPKIQEALNDEWLMQRFTQLSQMVYNQKSKQLPAAQQY